MHSCTEKKHDIKVKSQSSAANRDRICCPLGDKTVFNSEKS